MTMETASHNGSLSPARASNPSTISPFRVLTVALLVLVTIAGLSSEHLTASLGLNSVEDLTSSEITIGEKRETIDAEDAPKNKVSEQENAGEGHDAPGQKSNKKLDSLPGSGEQQEPPAGNPGKLDPVRPWGNRLYENNAALYYGLQRRRNYSSHYCIYGAKRFTLVHDWTVRQCVFRNLGIDENGTLVYHRAPDAAKDGIIAFDNEPTLFKAYDVTIKITSEPIDWVKTYSRTSLPDSRSKAIILASAKDKLATVPGHDWDFLFWVFNGMYHTGLLSLENRLVLATYPKHFGRLSKVWSALANQPVSFDAFKADYARSIVPFIQIVPRLNDILQWPTLRSGYFATLLRDRAFKLLEIQPPPDIHSFSPTIVPKLMLRSKTSGGHRFLNHEEVLQHLRSRCKECIVKDFDPSSLSLKEELSEIASTHIYITPCGGGSMSAFVLPDGATAIIGDVCFPAANGTEYLQSAYFVEPQRVACLHMDGPLWDAIPHLFTRYLQAERVHAWPMDKPRGYLRYNFNVSLPQLDAYVNDAFQSMGFHRFP